MKKIQIIHNPTAGDGKHNKQSLLSLFSEFCEVASYISTEEEGWTNFLKEGGEVVYIAGGDGTVRKVAQIIYKSKLPPEKIPALGILALGTANNIADTLGISSNEEVPKISPLKNRRGFDCGKVKGLKEEDFFMESFGAGIFPELVKKSEEEGIEEEDPSEELKQVLLTFVDLVKNYKAKKGKIKADGINIKGSFLMVEVMNIQSLGPNLTIAPDADPGDGYFDLVLITEEKRDALLDYLNKMINGQNEANALKGILKTFRVKKLHIVWEGNSLHVDDRLVEEYNGNEIKLELLPGKFEFIC